MMFIEMLAGTVSSFLQSSSEFTIFDYLCVVSCLFCAIFVAIPVVRYFKRRIEAILVPIMFSYQHVLITGCSSGLGHSLVREIFHRGAVITMISRDDQKLEDLKKELDVSTSCKRY